MRKDKDIAFQLRKEGKSYRQIEAELHISRSTLCDWFRDVPWSRHLKVDKTKQTSGPENMAYIRSLRSKKLQNTYKNALDEAVVEYETYKKEPLFWAGLMIYAGAGDKCSGGVVRITSSEFYLHRVFIAFVEKYMRKKRGDIKFGLLVYPTHNESLCKEMWSNLTGIRRENFYKTQVIRGKERVKRLQYGVGMSIISSTILKKKMLKWLSLGQDEKFDFDAIIV